MIPNADFQSGMHYYQKHMLWAFDNKLARFFTLEWARRHRKTTLLINLLIRESCRVPKAKYVYVAPTQVWARNVVWDDPLMLRSNLPDKAEMNWETNEAKMLVEFANGSMLKIGGSDKPDTFRGIDALGIGFDEWSLCREELWTEIFRPIIAGPLPPHISKMFGEDVFRWAMFLYTPKGINHAPLMFDSACMVGEGGELPEDGPAMKMRHGWYASRIDAEQAGIMSNYELEEARRDMPKVLYDQEMRCKRATDEECTLITSAMLNDLYGVDWEAMRFTQTETRKIVSIDPAFGGDKCVIRGMENTRTVERRESMPNKTEQIIMEAKQVAKIIGTKNFICDVIGWGKGVYDGLAGDEAGYSVQAFNSAEKPKSNLDQQLYRNMRAKAYAYASEKIRKIRCEAIHEKELLRQLPVASKYRPADISGKLMLIPKEEVKKILKCSPDDADSLVMGLYGLQFVLPEEGRPIPEGTYRDRRFNNDIALNPMTC